ncbi:retron system putative HNH endonuclease [Blautia producta]|uniref:retron system putative HNH endonuclease n=1 Tax=Blautia producta TaxID=33035 RepID=UPI0031B5B3AD
MRYIEKSEEPKSLTEYKKNRNAYFDGLDKDEIRAALLKEQGYLCGYCMRRIKSEKETKIEHIVPQSVLREDERQALDYKIMLGVCYGNSKKGRKKEALTCDAHRGNEDLHVNPFNSRHINDIKYTSEGRIFSDDEEMMESLDQVLNLNYDGPDTYLMKNRAAVLQACKNKLSELQKQGTWNKKLLQQMLMYYEKPDDQGRMIPYSGIAIWYLKKKLSKV